MTTCPRCGTGVMPTATVCTACCLPLNEARPETSPPGELTALEAAAADLAVDESDDFDAAREALTRWPFGGADPETVREVAEATSAETRPRLAQAADRASRGLRGELQIPTQRAAAFHAMRISSTPPPPSRYVAAERRQHERFASAPAKEGAPKHG